MRQDFETADQILPSIDEEHRTRVAQFLEKQGFKEQAMAGELDVFLFCVLLVLHITIFHMILHFKEFQMFLDPVTC